MENCLNFNILEILNLERNESYKKNTHNKQCWVLACRLYGQSTFTFGEKQMTARRGDILYIPLGATYSQSCLEAEGIVCFHLSILGSPPKKEAVFTPHHPDKICRLFKKASDTWNENEKRAKYLCMSLLYSIIAECDFFTQSEKEQSIIKNSVDYIHAHLFDPDFSLDSAYKAANITRAYFNRIFLKEYGTTPVKYVQKKRIEKAMFLIASDNYSREEVATLCGFKDTKYFYTVFKKITGMTTKEYGLKHIPI